jgi:hypothetical protein
MFARDACEEARVARRHMRAMFLTYLLLIVLGLAYFTLIGLAHH